MAGLALEVVWSKYLSLLLGNSTHGVATVVAAFLGGLGLGAALAGRRSAALRNPLAGYAVLEGIVGALALLSPHAYPIASPLFAGLYQALGGPGPLFHGIRFLVLFAALLLPTVAMGATLPLLVEDAARRRPASSSGAVARLYAINTAGAMAGTLAAGFVLIPGLGLAKTATLAGLVDLALMAVLLGSRAASPPPAPAPVAPVAVAVAPAPFARVILPAIGLSGALAILYQVTWTRLLEVPFGGLVYAFSAILAVYLLGLALEAAAAAPIVRRARAPAALFGLHAVNALPHWQASAIGVAAGSAPRLLLAEAAIAGIILLPPTVLLGALFPTAVAVHRTAAASAARSTGAVYAANTIGAIAGSLLTAFVLIPRFGSPASILGAAGVNALLACAALLGSESAVRFRRAGAALVAAGALAYGVLAMPTWTPDRLSLGLVRLLRSYWYGGEGLTHRLIDVDPGWPIFYREGSGASVAVIDTRKMRTLLINGKADASVGEDAADMRSQVFLGLLPLLEVPSARDLFVIGYGSGVTSGVALHAPVREVRTVELEPAVIEAAPLFAASAGNPLANPRHRLTIEDANLVLRSEDRTYDVIVSEPSNFWIAGMANLFTDDFYRVAAARIRPGGLLCRWVQCYQVSPEALACVLRTLARSFPRGQVFAGSTDFDLIFLASPRGEVALDPANWEQALRNPGVAADFARVGVAGPADLLRYYRGRLDRLAARAGAGPVNTDDNGWIEHRAPLDLLAQRGTEPLLAWNDDVAADLAVSLRAAPDRAAALLEEAAGRAAAAGDSGAAAGLREARARLAR